MEIHNFPSINGTGYRKIIFAALMILIQERKMDAGGETTNYTEFSTAYTGLPQVIRGDGAL
jgi:hypothetical protein